MKTAILATGAFLALGLAGAPARASLVGASVDVQFLGGSLNQDFGSVALGTTPSVFDTTYGYVTVSASQLTIRVPSYITGNATFSYGVTSFVGFDFIYGTGATVTDASLDATSVQPTGLLDLFPQVAVNLSGMTLTTTEAVVLNVTGNFLAPVPPAVPEPGTFALLLPALVGLVVVRPRWIDHES